MEEIEENASNCDILDSCQLEKIAEKDLSEFMLNPFKRAAHFRDVVFQKYTLDVELDEVILMQKFEFKSIAFAAYKSKKVYTQNEFDDFNIDDLDDSFVAISKINRLVAKIMAEAIERAKVDKLDEIKDKPVYDILYTRHYKAFFKPIVFSKIIGEDFKFPAKSVISISTINFVRSLTLMDLIGITEGNLKTIEAFVNEFIFSNNFIEREIVFERIKQEADDYFKAGHFNQREILFKNYIDKVKSSGLKQFTAKLTNGTFRALKNEVSCSGQVKSAKDKNVSIDFESIKSIEYNGKVIYDKDLVWSITKQ